MSRIVALVVFAVSIGSMSCLRLFTVRSTTKSSLLSFGRNTARRSMSLAASGGNSPVRVRFAPSPTGSLHVGGARTALFNWLFAKKTNGKFIIRVEDTDEARSTEASEASILNDLKWLNLDWDEGPEVGGPFAPYRQSERKEIYAQAAEKLISEGKAYRCFATEAELEHSASANATDGDNRSMHFHSPWRDATTEEIQAKLDSGAPYAVRFRVPAGKSVTILDKVRGIVSWETDAALLGDFVILRSNGMPVYNFCVSVDDAEMQITHVIRAEEHLSNTLRQMLILEALKFKPPTYAHCSLILGSDRSKLSKRHGATSVTQFSQQGFVPEAMLNYLANLGWNDGTNKEIYTPQELCEAFSLERIVKAAAVFDMDKLRWINAQHLRLRTAEQMRPIVLRELCTDTITSDPLVVDSTNSTSCVVNSRDTVYNGTLALLPAAYNVPDAELQNIFASADKLAQFNAFLAIATKIAQRDMEVTTDTKRLVVSCLEYNMTHTLRHDAHVEELLISEALPAVVQALIADYHSGTLPRTTGDPAFTEAWKAYMKDLGKRLGLKGKGVFHPVRLCLTGRVSGPDVGDQLQLLALSEGLLSPQYMGRVDLAQRIAFLERFDVAGALEVCRAGQRERAEQQAKLVAATTATGDATQ
jgi:glutamyl-tRNA synthetase